MVYHPKFHEKLSKAEKILREYNEKQKEFNVEDKLRKLEQQVSSTTSEQTKELGIKLNELERKMESNSTQTKKLNDKLEEILKLLKRENREGENQKQKTETD